MLTIMFGLEAISEIKKSSSIFNKYFTKKRSYMLSMSNMGYIVF